MTAELAGVLAAAGRAIAEATWVGVLVGGAALLLSRPSRRLPPRVQAWFWWLVAARLLVELGGSPALELAWLPPAEVVAPAAPTVAVSPPAPSSPATAELAVVPVTSEAPAAAVAGNARVLTGWIAVGGLWIAGAAWALGRTARAQREIRRLVCRAAPVTERDELAALAAAAQMLGVSKPVALVRSSEVASPLVVGLRSPVVVLPAAPRLAPEELRLALLHELAHVRHRDSWCALVPALVRRLLFFHPVAVWAEREFALAVEAACDAEVVARSGAPRRDYGALLVRVALAGRSVGRRSASAFAFVGPNLNRRLHMLSSPSPSLSPRRLASLAPFAALAAVAVAVPIRLVAAEPASASPPTGAQPTVLVAAQAVAPAEEARPVAAEAPSAGARWVWSSRLERLVPAPPAPSAPPSAPAAPAAPAPAARPHPPAPPALPRAPLAPLAPMAPLPPLPPALPELRGADWLVLRERDARLAIDAGRWAQRRAEELAERDGRPVLLLGRDGESWVVRDEAAIDSVRRIFFAAREETAQGAAIAREAAMAARERSRQALAESRRALADRARAVHGETEHVARLARLEAQRVSELARELERLEGDAHVSALRSAEAASRALADLESELERMRAEEDDEHRRRDHAARQAFDADRLRFEAELERLDERAAESRQELERRLAELARELERRLDDLFARGLAAPLEK